MDLNCPYFIANKCRSCSLLHLSNASEILSSKQTLINELLAQINSNQVQVSKLWSPKNLFHSRAKARLTVTGTKDKPILGLVDKDFNGIELERCPLHLKLINKVVLALPKIISELNLTPYNIKKRVGELKNLIVISNSEETEVILRFVLRSENLVEKIKKAIPAMQQQVKELSVISVNIQPIPHQIAEGEKEIILTEQEYIWQSYNKKKFPITPKAFIQVTPETAEVLYEKVAKRIEELEIKSVLDLYCGIGGFAIHAAKAGAKAIGIEISKPSIKCANLALERNSINSVKFYSGSVEESIVQHSPNNLDAIICNPPRRGLGQETLDHILRISPRYLIYSSCNGKTFLNDLKTLKQTYKLKEIHPFDMFPLTNHVEILSIFEKSDVAI